MSLSALTRVALRRASLVPRSASSLTAAASSSSSSRLSSRLTASSPSTTTLVRHMSAKADEDLAQFLTEEIKAERGNQRQLPQLEGFQVASEGAEITLTKDAGGEKVVVQLNVNHTVDSADPDDGSSQEAPEMKSKPNFEVDLVRGGKTLSFSCAFIYDHDGPEKAAQEEGYDDVFAIEEVTLFEGEWNEKKYAVAGDILDGYLYDLFMNMLDERGVNKAFAERLSEYCSSYEQSQYIDMLEKLQQFVKK